MKRNSNDDNYIENNYIENQKEQDQLFEDDNAGQSDEDYFDEGYLDEDDFDTAAYAKQLEEKQSSQSKKSGRKILIGVGILAGIAVIAAVVLAGRFSHPAETGENVIQVDPTAEEQAAASDPAPEKEPEEEADRKEDVSPDSIITTDLSLDMGDGESLTIDKDTLLDWVRIAEDGSASLDADAVASYVSELSDQYNTIYQNRTFKTHDGNTITTSGGSYGWWLDEGETAAAIKSAVTDKTFKAAAVWHEQPSARGDNSACGSGSFGGDIGSSYVEVDLDNQHVYMWVNGSCVMDTDCVSGKAAAGNGTPDGVYPITYKERDATLVGENYSSAVSYWMPFNGNVGLHDASWRSSFGGDIYVSGGSHGCVNLPVSAAAQLFTYVEKGMAVVVYGGMTQTEAVAYLGTKVDADTQAEAAANAQYLANANAIAAKYGIDTTGASVNADGSVSYAIGATIYQDGHITGADGSTIVEAPSVSDTTAAADTSASAVDATAAAQAAQEAAAQAAALETPQEGAAQ